jgi:Protein of unknown function (DUF3024)
MPLPELVQRKAQKSLGLFCAESGRVESPIPRIRFSQHEAIFALWQVAIGSEALDLPVAQLRYHELLGQWTLHYPDVDGRWRFYLNCGPSLDLDKLLQHLKLDPFQTFWV